MAAWTLRLHDAGGGYAAELDVIASLDLALPANDVGALVLSLPITYPFALFQKDGRILVERTVRGITRVMVFLIRQCRRVLTDAGEQQIQITAYDPRDLLRRRIVALVSQSTKTDAYDDMMKAIVREQFTAATDPARNLSSDLFTVAADVGAAPSGTLEFANRGVLDVLRDIAAASAEAGTYLAFDVVPVASAFQFQTFIGVWGTDRRGTVLLSAERGTLSAVETAQDWTTEHTAVYAHGRGELAATAVDSARVAGSPFGRIETYLSASNAATLASVQAAAAAELQAGRPREQFSARLVEQPGLQFGADLWLGDLVQAEDAGTLYDCRVEPIHLSVDEDGRETVDVQLRNIA